MANHWNVQRSLAQKCETITDFLSRMKFFLNQRNKFIGEQNLMDSVQHLETINIIEEIQFANSAVEVMKAYVRTLEEEEKRRQLTSKVRIELSDFKIV